jgi:hypothetical protein
MFEKLVRKLKPKTKEEKKTQKRALENTLYIEFADKYVSYYLNSEKIQSINLHVQKYKNTQHLLDTWRETLELIFKTVSEKEVALKIFLKSKHFLVQNKVENENSFLSSKLGLDEESIKSITLKEECYLIIENNFLKDILFTLKDYSVDNIYDISLINSMSIKNRNSLYIDISMNSFEILLNRSKIQKRVLKKTLSSFIEECASSLYVDFETAYQNITLNFNSSTTYQELESSTKKIYVDLKNFIDYIYDEIYSTISFFNIHDKTEFIDSILINGDILEFDFIINILSQRLDIEFLSLDKIHKVNSTEKINLNLIKSIKKDQLENLDIDFEGLVYSDTKNRYVFDNYSFKLKEDLNKIKINYKKDEKIVVPEKFQKPIWKMEVKEIVEFIKWKSENSTSESKKRFLFSSIGVMLVSLFLIFFTKFVFDLNNEFTLSINTLESRVKRIDLLKQELLRNDQKFILQEEKIDKIFWTKKIITIANLMPNEIWLSSISIKDNTQIIENKEVTSQSMILSAKTLNSGNGHVYNIAKYMNKLLNAQDDFRKDFSGINFGGATTENNSTDGEINFKLLCNFKKNINIKEIEEKKRVERNSIMENLQNIKTDSNDKNRILDNI